MKLVEPTVPSNTALEQSIRTILQEIGENPNREGLLDTPARVARMYREVFSQVGVNPEIALTTTFEESYEGSILVKDISYFTFCEHHLIPFYGTAHIAYIPNGQIVGLSKFARLVELTAARPQVQERMTTQIAEAIWNVLKPKGVIVSLEGTHLCMCARGVKKPGSATVTIVKKGLYAEQENLCQEFQRSLTR